VTGAGFAEEPGTVVIGAFVGWTAIAARTAVSGSAPVGGPVVVGGAVEHLVGRRLEHGERGRAEFLGSVVRDPPGRRGLAQPALKLCGPVFKHREPIGVSIAHIFEIAVHVAPLTGVWFRRSARRW